MGRVNNMTKPDNIMCCRIKGDKALRLDLYQTIPRILVHR